MNEWLGGLELVFRWQPLIFMLIGTVGGIVVGAIPGLTSTMSIAILLPFTFIFEPLTGLCLLLGIYSGSVYAGSIPAILLRVPGTPASAATVLDGYPMAKNGQAGKALMISLAASTIGAIIGGVLLLFFAPVLAEYALRFGSAEFFMLSMFAIALIASMSEGAMIKGLVSGLLGLLIATVGTDPIGGFPRFTFGLHELGAGLGFIPVLIGLFGVAEALTRFEQRAKLGKLSPLLPGSFRLRTKEMAGLLPGVTYSSVIGFGVGVLPGTGGDIGSFIGHNEVRRLARNNQNFGKGDPRGLAAAESANNASVPGTLAPTLVLGIPGNSAAAVLIGALTVHGLQPGPQLFSAAGDLIYAIFFALLIIPLMMLLVGLLGIRSWGQITRIPTHYLWPCILALCVIGSYAVRSSFTDVLVMIGAGLLGYFMLKGGFPPAPLVIGLIVGPIAETGFRRATISYGGSLEWMLQPIPLILLILSILTMGTSLYRTMRRARRTPVEVRAEGQRPDLSANETEGEPGSASGDVPKSERTWLGPR